MKTRSFKNAHDTQFLDLNSKVEKKELINQRFEHDKLKIDRAVIQSCRRSF